MPTLSRLRVRRSRPSRFQTAPQQYSVIKLLQRRREVGRLAERAVDVLRAQHLPARLQPLLVSLAHVSLRS